jgi:L-ribulose-5-phosphate 3-epimerase
MARIGFMQGRLSPLANGKVQSFPWHTWEVEFEVAARAGFPLIEWTLDAQRLHENPLLNEDGQSRIRKLATSSHVEVQSLTGDCFMQTPYWKADDVARGRLLDDLDDILESCVSVGIRFVVMPLVDNGNIQNSEQRDSLVDGLLSRADRLARRKLQIIFESDLAPPHLAKFVAMFPAPTFGINYDIGNSASLGFDPVVEMRAYGDRVYNVHVKDRVHRGNTVPLGDGDAQFPTVFSCLARSSYPGDYILQTARAQDGDHLGALLRYRGMVCSWLGTTAG